MTTDKRFTGLRVDRRDGVVTATIDHPPINLLDRDLMVALDALTRDVADDPDARVLVLGSANDDFFIAHADVSLILGLPASPAPREERLGFFHAMTERLRTMPKVTIAKIAGCARGGGSEIALACDMRFAAAGKAVLGQPEVALGILPGGGGTQRLAALVGRARAAEIILGCGDFDAEGAERYGWVNRALPPEELDGFVAELADRIARFPVHAIALSKRALDAAAADLPVGLVEEERLFFEAAATPVSKSLMTRFLEDGGQTAAVEKDLGAWLAGWSADRPS